MLLRKRMVKGELLAGLLTLLLFLSLVHPCVGNIGRETVVVFKGEETEVPYIDKSGAQKIRKPRSFHAPVFVGGVVNKKEFLAIFSGGHFADYSHFIPVEGVARTSYGDYKKWTAAEIFTQDAERSKTHILTDGFTAVMKGSKIYVLAASFFKPTPALLAKKNADNGWDPLMIVGTVMVSTGSNMGGATIKWEKAKSLKDAVPNTVLGAQGIEFVGIWGNGIVTRKGAIVFPIRMKRKKDEITSSIMYSTDDGSTWKIGGKTTNGPFVNSVVEWGDGKLLFTVPPDGRYRKILESDDMGTTWKESLVFSRVWGNQGGRTGYGDQGTVIKIPVDEKDVLLFLHSQNDEERQSGQNLQLWISDGQRIVRVGTVNEDNKNSYIGFWMLAHVGNHLYFTHESNFFGPVDNTSTNKGSLENVVGLRSLPELFKSAKTAVRAWRELDIRYSMKGIPTNGLVGFLEDEKNDTVWSDMYKCVNANVNGATRVDGGFRFAEAPGSGAQWPVQSQGQNQLYAFAEKQFTLIAIVMIHATKKTGKFSLLGASLDSEGNNVHLGLGYTHDDKWYIVSHGNKEITTSKLLKKNKEYIVTLTFVNGAASVFVDGVDIAGRQINISGEASISHFYMGGMGKTSSAKGSLCTVRNVMLFNRELRQKEMENIFNMSKHVEDKRGDGAEMKFLITACVCLVYFVSVLMFFK